MNAMTAEHHIIPLKVYLLVGFTLIVFTAITVWVSFFDFGAWNMVVAMVIAAFKATLVVLFFMHLLYDHKMYAIVFLTSLVFLATFVVITMFDTLGRDRIYAIQAQPIEAHAIIYRKNTAPTESDSSAHSAETESSAEEAESSAEENSGEEGK